MKKFLLLIIISVLVGPGALPGKTYGQGYENPQIFADADWVAAHKDNPNVILVDVRSPIDYAKGHISGAIYIPWKSLRDKKGVFIGVEKASRILGLKGIDNTMEVVAYGDRGGAIASYLFWMLEYMEHEKVRLFDGGMEVWTAEGRELSTRIEELPSTTYKAKGVKESILVKNKWVLERLGDPNYIIVDPRRAVEFYGQKIKGEDLRGGHVPGAINIDCQIDQWQDEKLKKIKSAAGLIDLYQAQGITRDMNKKLILFCRTTRRTTYMYFGLRLIGFKPEQLIMADEGYIFWANDPAWPMEEETFAK
jgi:thiosulfate/3-mercaptopyruvate sulfurtransferase